MNETMEKRCEQFTADTAAVQKCGISLVSSILTPFCAFLFAANGQTADSASIKASADALSHKVKIFSSFMEAMYAPTACMLTMSSDPETETAEYFANLEILKKSFADSRFMAMAGILLNRRKLTPDEFETKAARAKVIYDCLKQRHKLNTGFNDAMLTVLLAFTEKSVEDILAETDQLYPELKKLTSGEHAQLMALILSYSDKPAAEKLERVEKLYRAFPERGAKYYNGADMVVLAGLSLLTDDPESMADEVVEYFNALAEKKSYKGFFSTYDKSSRMCHAVMLAILGHMAEDMYEIEIAAAFLTVLYKYDVVSTAAYTPLP